MIVTRIKQNKIRYMEDLGAESLMNPILCQESHSRNSKFRNWKKRILSTESIGKKLELKWVGQKQQFIHVLQTWSYKHHTELARKNRHHLIHHASFQITSIELQHQNKSVTELHSSSNIETSPWGWLDWLIRQTINLHVSYSAGFVNRIQDIHIDIVIHYKTV